LADEYRLSAPDQLRASKPFLLAGHPDDHLSLAARSKASWAFPVGVTLAVLGTAATIAGGVLAGAALRASPSSYDGGGRGFGTGLAVLGIGGTVLVSGMLLWFFSSSVTVDQSSSTARRSRAAPLL